MGGFGGRLIKKKEGKGEGKAEWKVERKEDSS